MFGRGAVARGRARARIGLRGPGHLTGRRRRVPRVRGRHGRCGVVAGECRAWRPRRRRWKRRNNNNNNSRSFFFLFSGRLFLFFLGAGGARLLLRRPRQRLLRRRPLALLRAGRAPSFPAAHEQRRCRASFRFPLESAEQCSLCRERCQLLVSDFFGLCSSACRGAAEGAGGALARDRGRGAGAGVCAGRGEPFEACARLSLWVRFFSPSLSRDGRERNFRKKGMQCDRNKMNVRKKELVHLRCRFVGAGRREREKERERKREKEEVEKKKKRKERSNGRVSTSLSRFLSSSQSPKPASLVSRPLLSGSLASLTQTP